MLPHPSLQRFVTKRLLRVAACAFLGVISTPVALKCERSQVAIELLDECLAECPEDQSGLLNQHIEEAKRQLARWN